MPMNEPTMPVIFVSHGSPTMPFDEIPARTFLVGLGFKDAIDQVLLAQDGRAFEAEVVRNEHEALTRELLQVRNCVATRFYRRHGNLTRSRLRKLK